MVNFILKAVARPESDATMAKRFKAYVKPKAQIITSDDEEEDQDEDVNALPTLKSPIAPANDDHILHLGSDLPEVPTESTSQDTNPNDAHAETEELGLHADPSALEEAEESGEMGANNSREELNSAIHATSAALLERSSTAAESASLLEATRRSTGKLKRISQPGSSPRGRKPIVSRAMPVPRQRRIVAAPRPDILEVPPSPERSNKPLSPAKVRQLRQKAAVGDKAVFSPLKRQTRAMRQKSSALDDASAEGQHNANEQLSAKSAGRVAIPAEVGRQEGRGRNASDERALATEALRADTRAGAEMDTQDVKDQDRFRTTYTMDEHPHVETIDDGQEHGPQETGSEAMSAMRTSEEIEETTVEVQTTKRKRGRPRKVQHPEQPARRASPRQVVRTSSPAPHEQAEASSSQAVKPDRQQATQVASESGEAVSGGDDMPSSRPQGRIMPTIPRAVTRSMKATNEVQRPQKISSTRAQRAINAKAPVINAVDEEDNGAEEEAVVAATAEAEDELVASHPREGGTSSVQIAQADVHPRISDPRQIRKRKAAVIQADELSFEEDGQNALASSPETDNGRQASTSPRKRARVGRSVAKPATANTSRKRKHFESAVQPDEIEASDSDEVAENNPQRLYGYWPRLQRVFKAVNTIGKSYHQNGHVTKHRLKLKDKQVKQLVAWCVEIEEAYSELQDAEAAQREELETGIQAQLNRLDEMVDNLHEDNEEWELDLENETMIQDVFAFAFPALVALLKRMALCYAASDAAEKEGAISDAHQQRLLGFMAMIIDLRSGLAKYIAKPPSTYNVVKPIHNDVVAPLKDIHKDLSTRLMRRQRAHESAEVAARRAEQMRLRQEREEEERRRWEQVRRVKEKWNRLHLERRWAETGGRAIPIRKEKFAHLAFPSSLTEEDFDGIPFERMQLFTPRTGPTPSMMNRVRQVEWSDRALAAVWFGLENYSGTQIQVLRNLTDLNLT